MGRGTQIKPGCLRGILFKYIQYSHSEATLQYMPTGTGLCDWGNIPNVCLEEEQGPIILDLACIVVSGDALNLQISIDI